MNKQFRVAYRSLGRDEKGNDDPLRTVDVTSANELSAIADARVARGDIHYIVSVKAL